MRPILTRLCKATPVLVSASLVLAACGSGDDADTQVAQQPAGEQVTPAAPVQDSATVQKDKVAAADPAAAKTVAKPVTPRHKAAVSGSRTTAAVKAAAPSKQSSATAGTAAAKGDGTAEFATAADKAAYDASNGATDIGITRNSIKFGSINMHGIGLGNLIVEPQVRAMNAAATAINDRGGILGRRVSVVDCDDGPGEVSRAKACIKKLVSQDKIFALVTAIDWATASIHDDLKQHKLPYFGAWAYSQTEWQNPWMFPAHMSMIHEAMAGANWARNVIRPKTYGLLCLTSPEMQLACAQVQRILDASGAKLVKKADVSISESSMSAYVVAMRAANPEHIIHYVINPSTIVKFLIESAQQHYYPPKGISGNHMAVEELGSIYGKWPTGRYWTNTTYKLWGAEYMALMNKYAPANRGLNHHITQAGYFTMNMLAKAGKQVGPNLTRAKLMALLSQGDVWASDIGMDQRWSWSQSERHNDRTDQRLGQGREFMYKYTSTNTVSNPDGSPSGLVPDPDQFVINTAK